MNKTVLGFVTFGGIEFTKLLVESVKNTTSSVDMFAVVGNSDDKETISYLLEMKIPFIVHYSNHGFPVSVNDIFDYAWKEHNYEYVILAGNDVIAYPYCIDSMIDCAETTDIEVIGALEYSVKDLVNEFPESRGAFIGRDYVIREFVIPVWNLFTEYWEDYDTIKMELRDIQNMCLYKKSVFEKVGYLDVNFYPAYFVDNDYAMRMKLLKIKMKSLLNARYFHFWSRTIKQGSGGSTPTFFEKNKYYYKQKWGGEPGFEKKRPESLNITSREKEAEIVNYWKAA